MALVAGGATNAGVTWRRSASCLPQELLPQYAARGASVRLRMQSHLINLHAIARHALQGMAACTCTAAVPLPLPCCRRRQADTCWRRLALRF